MVCSLLKQVITNEFLPFIPLKNILREVLLHKHYKTMVNLYNAKCSLQRQIDIT